MGILEAIKQFGRINVFTNQALCIYSKDSVSYSECFDTLNNSQLNIDNIDDSYGLDIVEHGDRIDVFIPRNARCILHFGSSNVDCTVLYKNIECDLIFEDELIDNYFTIID